MRCETHENTTYDLLDLTKDELYYLNSVLIHSCPSAEKWKEIRHKLFYGTPDTPNHLSKKEIDQWAS